MNITPQDQEISRGIDQLWRVLIMTSIVGDCEDVRLLDQLSDDDCYRVKELANDVLDVISSLMTTSHDEFTPAQAMRTSAALIEVIGDHYSTIEWLDTLELTRAHRSASDYLQFVDVFRHDSELGLQTAFAIALVTVEGIYDATVAMCDEQTATTGEPVNRFRVLASNLMLALPVISHALRIVGTAERHVWEQLLHKQMSIVEGTA